MSLPSFDPVVQEMLPLLLRQLMYATLVAAAVALPARWLQRRHPALAHALWSLVLIRLMIPPGWSSSLSLRGLWQRWTEPAVGGEALSAIPSTALPLPVAGDWIADSLSGSPTESSLAATALLVGWSILALCGIAVGVGRRRLYARLLDEPVRDPGVVERAARWRRCLGIRRRVELWTGEADQAPFTLGVLRPRIFLPRRLLAGLADPTTAPDAEDLIDAVLGHELAHVAHWDDAWLQVQRILLGLYLFFPPLWWACRAMHDARERMADARAVDVGPLPARDYALALLRVHQLQLNRPQAVSAFGPDPRRLLMRVRSILDVEVRGVPGKPSGGWLLAVALTFLLLPMAAPTVQAEGPALGDGATGPADDGGSQGRTVGQWPLQHPLEGARLTAGFGPWKSPFQEGPTHHDGIDLAIAEGTVIVAPAAGVVSEAETDPQSLGDYGVILRIDHGDGMETTFAHLAEVVVEVGQRVEAGQPIATVGMSGKTTGPHLHFEVRQDGRKVDPQPMIRDFC